MTPYAVGVDGINDSTKFFDALDENTRLFVMIRADDTLSLALTGDRQFVVTVPPGTSACLRIRPVVDKSLFEKVFDKGLMEWAVGTIPGEPGELVVFEGAALQIEVMTEGVPPVARDAL